MGGEGGEEGNQLSGVRDKREESWYLPYGLWLSRPLVKGGLEEDERAYSSRTFTS